MTKTTLPATHYHRSMSGALIPHSVNPGPQICCSKCGLLRFGSDFQVVGAGVVCSYCAGR